jgi:hypothetical protein
VTAADRLATVVAEPHLSHPKSNIEDSSRHLRLSNLSHHLDHTLPGLSLGENLTHPRLNPARTANGVMAVAPKLVSHKTWMLTKVVLFFFYFFLFLFFFLFFIFA